MQQEAPSERECPGEGGAAAGAGGHSQECGGGQEVAHPGTFTAAMQHTCTYRIQIHEDLCEGYYYVPELLSVNSASSNAVVLTHIECKTFQSVDLHQLQLMKCN